MITKKQSQEWGRQGGRKSWDIFKLKYKGDPEGLKKYLSENGRKGGMAKIKSGIDNLE